ncbi:MAG: metalloregulator ArsR/SmtB family transcription factor [Chitinivibrionales bacterium]|nr:metalloregulator ArsR/SmtB family transcription factor [Chitinivibrionales bacterium]
MYAADNGLNRLTRLAKALSDPNRVRALAALREGELCVCQLIDLLELAPSTVSKHMAIVKMAGLVESRKDSRWVYYRLAGAPHDEAAGQLLKGAFEVVKYDPQIAADNTEMQRIRAGYADERCSAQRDRTASSHG